MTMYDSRLNLSKQVVQEVKSYFKDKLFKTLIYRNVKLSEAPSFCLLYTSDAADEEDSVDLGGRRIIKKKNNLITTSLPSPLNT